MALGLVVLAATLVGLVAGKMVPYPSPGGGLAPSPLYTVAVSSSSASGAEQSDAEVFVYYLNNTWRSTQAYAGPANRSSSWAAFSTDGAAPVAVTVTAAFAVTSCTLRPRSYGLTCAVKGDNTVVFHVPRPRMYISVELGQNQQAPVGSVVMHSLMVFADPLEEPSSIPSPSDPSVAYFPRGVHYIPGGLLVLPPHVTHVYAAPGAYIHGGIKANATDNAITLSGRGVFSGETFPFHDPRFQWSLLELTTGSSHSVDGITIVDPPKYYFRTYGSNVTVKNVKMAVAWTYNTDGFVGGAGSLIEDSFLRSNDDTLKMYTAGTVAQRLVIWQNENGGVTQTGWWSSCVRHNMLVQDIDIIHAEWWTHNSYNNAIVDHDWHGVKHVDVQNFTLRNVRVEESIVLAVMHVEARDAQGQYSNVVLENFEIDGWVEYNKLLVDPNVKVNNIVFRNVTVQGRCLDNVSAANFSLSHGASVQFECPG